MKISHSRSQSYRVPQTPGEEGSAQVFKATSDEAETQARHSIVQGELHFGRRDLGRTCLAAGACSTTTGGEAAALLPLTAMCRTPWALASTNRRGVVRSRNQRGVARTGQERNAGADSVHSYSSSTMLFSPRETLALYIKPFHQSTLTNKLRYTEQTRSSLLRPNRPPAPSMDATKSSGCFSFLGIVFHEFANRWSWETLLVSASLPRRASRVADRTFATMKARRL